MGSLPVCGKLDCLCASGLQPQFSEGDLKGASPVTSKLILKEKGNLKVKCQRLKGTLIGLFGKTLRMNEGVEQKGQTREIN